MGTVFAPGRRVPAARFKLTPVALLATLVVAKSAHADPPIADERHDEEVQAPVPLSMRGGVSLQLDGYKSEMSSTDVGSAVFAVTASIPIQGRTFVDGRIPFAVGLHDWEDDGPDSEPFFGNVGIGAHHVLALTDRLWLSLGGALTLPTNVPANDTRVKRMLTAPRGYWDAHDFLVWPLGVEGNAAVEGHIGEMVILRAVLDMILVPRTTEKSEDLRFVIQHAAEAHFGHEIGGGLRLQGVFVPTDERDYTDIYVAQLAAEPYFSYEGGLVRGRLGLMIPITEPLAPPFVEGWGLRSNLGVVIQ